MYISLEKAASKLLEAQVSFPHEDEAMCEY